MVVKTPIIIGLFIITLCNVLGHYFPPFSLFTSYIYMGIIIGLINDKLYKSSFRFTIIYNFFILLLNDFLIRKFAGGSHDSAGMAWCSVMFGLTMIFSVGFMLVAFFRLNKINSKPEKKVYTNLLVLIIGLVITIIYYSNFQSTI